MITNITLANHGPFDQEVNLEVKPLTFLTGQPSTGKSTLMAFLETAGSALRLTPGEQPRMHHPREDNNHLPNSRRNARFTIQATTQHHPTPMTLTGEFQPDTDRSEPKVSYPDLQGGNPGEFQKALQAIKSAPVPTQGSPGSHTLTTLARLIDQKSPDLEFLNHHLRQTTGHHTLALHHHLTTGQRTLSATNPQGISLPLSLAGSTVSHLLELLAAGVTAPPGTTLLVQNPENGLPPQSQLELAQFLADLWTQRQVQTLVKTQSDAITLRPRRLAAKGALDHRHIAIAYFQQHPQDPALGPTITNVSVHPDGTLTPGLPMSHHGATITEGLRLGARS